MTCTAGILWRLTLPLDLSPGPSLITYCVLSPVFEVVVAFGKVLQIRRVMEDVTSESLFAGLVAVAILAILFSWIPTMDRVYPPCGRALKRLKRCERTGVEDSSFVEEEGLGRQQTR